jgi:hypothetical protein
LPENTQIKDEKNQPIGVPKTKLGTQLLLEKFNNEFPEYSQMRFKSKGLVGRFWSSGPIEVNNKAEAFLTWMQCGPDIKSKYSGGIMGNEAELFGLFDTAFVARAQVVFKPPKLTTWDDGGFSPCNQFTSVYEWQKIGGLLGYVIKDEGSPDQNRTHLKIYTIL